MDFMGFNGIDWEIYDGYPQLISLWVVAKSCTLDS